MPETVMVETENRTCSGVHVHSISVSICLCKVKERAQPTKKFESLSGR